MGKALAEAFPAARQVFEEADAALGFPLSWLCFEGPEDQLQLTENQQPALLTVSAAAFAVLSERGWRPDYVAGQSIGEYAALVAAGSLRFADAVRLVRKRGHYMQTAVPEGVGAMAALLRIPDGKLETVLEQAAQGEVVTASNFNSPDQTVIAGHAGAVARAVELAKAAGARRALMLPVSAPFHCPLMRPAQERLRADLDAIEFPGSGDSPHQQLAGTRSTHRRRSPGRPLSPSAQSRPLAGVDALSRGPGCHQRHRSGRGRRVDGSAARDRAAHRRDANSATRRTSKSSHPSDAHARLAEQHLDHTEVLVVIIARVFPHAFRRDHGFDDAGLHGVTDGVALSGVIAQGA